MLENYTKYPGKIERFCIIFPEEVETVDEAVEILQKEKREGAIGFGEHYGVGLDFDDPTIMRLYEACEKVGLPVMFHMDQHRNLDGKGLPRLKNVLKTFPDCILIAHSSGWWKNLADGTCDRLLKEYPNLYADLSVIAKQKKVVQDKKFSREFMTRHADKLLFGSDCGWWTSRLGMPPEFALIDELDLPEAVEEKILRENSLKLFPNKGE